MDRGHIAWLQRRCPADSQVRLALFLSEESAPSGAEVPDPYYGGEADFTRALDLVEAGARGWLARLSVELGR